MKDPAILFYTGDFLNGVVDLTMEERGQYITLLCLQHQKGHLSEKTIRLTVGSVSVDVMSKFAIDENGLYFNERMDRTIAERMQFIESRRVNGMKGGRPKQEDKPNGYPNGYPSDKANENLPENRNEDIDINIREDEFKKKVKTLNDEHGILKDIEKFVNYWTESSGNKLRYEKEKTFDLKKRMERWKMNQKDWGVQPEPAVEKKLNFAN